MEFLSPKVEKAEKGTGLGRDIRSLFFGEVELEMPVRHQVELLGSRWI